MASSQRRKPRGTASTIPRGRASWLSQGTPSWARNVSSALSWQLLRQRLLRRMTQVKPLLQKPTRETSRTMDASSGEQGGKSETGTRREGRLETDKSSFWEVMFLHLSLHVQSRPGWWPALPLPWTAPFLAAVQWSELSTLAVSPLLTTAGLAPLSLLLWISANPGYYERRTRESDLAATAICSEILFIILWTHCQRKHFRSRINTIQVWKRDLCLWHGSYLWVVNWKKKTFQ